MKAVSGRIVDVLALNIGHTACLYNGGEAAVRRA
jgi:hypothetical protein